MKLSVEHAATSQVLRAILTLSALAYVVAPGLAHAQPAPSVVRETVESITQETVLNHIAVLASDQLLGRDTPSEGLETAAAYLADLHRSYGLQPAGENGTFFQRYPFGFMGPDTDAAQATITGPDGTAEIRIGSDAFVDGGTEDSFDAALVYVDLSRGNPAPGSLTGDVAVFELSGSWGQSLWQSSSDQASVARAAGAVAIVHVLDSGFSSSVISQMTSTLAQPTWRLGGDALLPRLFVRRGALESALPRESRPWESGATAAGVSPIGGASLRASLPLDVLSYSTPPNVIAEIPGSDPELSREYIVLTAHFDHVGVGRPVAGDSIYNGADDNGSGTAALLEVARALASLPPTQRPRRSVLFAHVSGEEKGLLGSEWWVDHPTRPIGSVIANINTDMVGGDAHPDTVAVLGNEYSSLGPLIMRLSRERPELRLTTVSDMWPQENLFFRSDQFNFMRKEIPSLFVFAGLHDCYHRPCDDLDFVNTDKVARVARLLAYAVLEVAASNDRPQWNASGLTNVRRMTSGGG